MLPTLLYTLSGLVGHPLAQCDPLNTTEKAGAKEAGTFAVICVNVVHDTWPKRSDPFIQYITSLPFVNLMRLSLAIDHAVVIAVSAPADVIEYSFSVPLILCLTISRSFAFDTLL